MTNSLSARIARQVAQGALRCPSSGERLVTDGSELRTVGGGRRYPIRNGVPFLFSDLNRHQKYLAENDGSMDREYRADRQVSFRARLSSMLLGGDFRTKASEDACASLFEGISDDAICLAVGGGPLRHHERLVNLNISDYENVDVVADAYELPYADGSVDAIFCEAVLEHLEFPEKAVGEMYRVLRPGGRVFAATPFLQWYHGYPNHFQNFTLTGHVRLFERAGFSVKQQGTCVGPGFAISMLCICYCRLYMGRALRFLFLPAVLVLAAIFRRLDQWINLRHSSHILSSTTYLLAEI